MKAPNPRVVLPVLLSFFTSVTFAAGGTRPVTTEAVESAVAAARGQIQALEESGEDPNVEAVRTSLAALWELGREQPDSVAGERATSEALSLLIRIGRVDEAAAKAAALGPDESAWDPLLEGLLGAAREVGRYEAFEKAASARLALLQARPDQQARLWFVLGRIHLAQDRRDEARQAFERVVAADSRASRRCFGAKDPLTARRAGARPGGSGFRRDDAER